jgi:hypothetical protein
VEYWVEYLGGMDRQDMQYFERRGWRVGRWHKQTERIYNLGMSTLAVSTIVVCWAA